MRLRISRAYWLGGLLLVIGGLGVGIAAYVHLNRHVHRYEENAAGISLGPMPSQDEVFQLVQRAHLRERTFPTWAQPVSSEEAGVKEEPLRALTQEEAFDVTEFALRLSRGESPSRIVKGITLTVCGIMVWTEAQTGATNGSFFRLFRDVSRGWYVGERGDWEFMGDAVYRLHAQWAAKGTGLPGTSVYHQLDANLEQSD